ncbi:Folliculin domain containing protein [Trichuris trichiura]|uniref:Folliculin n=1 Tax=Trichuris trichiura TaxID=36087 RepID=A0A077Z1R3_TRITR|nr:Folliculin domain containing protein [Trichuris trichiura]
MNAVVALCHFCEIHGPRVLFCCQPYHEEAPVHLQLSKSPSPLAVPFPPERDAPCDGATNSFSSKGFYGKFDCFAACLQSTRKDSDAVLVETSDLAYSLPKLRVSTSSLLPDLSGYFCCDTCNACRSVGSTFPGFLVNDHKSRISYVGSQFPYHPEVFTIVRHACLRSLSCEICPGREGPIFFGDSVCGYCLCYTFNVKDFTARGFHHLYSIIVVSMDRLLLLNNYDFFVSSLCTIAEYVQARAAKVFDDEQSRDQDRMKQLASMNKSLWLQASGFLRERRQSNPSNPRSLLELTGEEDVYRKLNRAFVWILRAQMEQCVEVILEGLPDQDHLIELETRHMERGFVRYLESDYDSFAPYRAEVHLGDIFTGVVAFPSVDNNNKGGDNSIEPFCTLSVVHLTHIARSLNKSSFRLLLYHLLVGNQTVVRSSDSDLVKMALDALKLLLPRGCVRQVNFSLEYLECWRCNLLGVSESVPLPLATLENPYVLLTIELQQQQQDSSQGDVVDDEDEPSDSSSTSDRLLQCAFGAKLYAFSSPTEYPALVNKIMTMVYEGDVSSHVLGKLLYALKQEWVNKAKLLYAMTKQFNNDEASVSTKWRLATRCKEPDEALVKFWQAGLSRSFKSYVMSVCSERQEFSSSTSSSSSTA